MQMLPIRSRRSETLRLPKGPKQPQNCWEFDALKNRSLSSGFQRSSRLFPDRTALEVDGNAYSYAQLHDRAASLAATLQHNQPKTQQSLTAVLAHRSITAFSGILGALLRGHGYVPANPNFPTDRIIAVIERSGCESLIVGSEARDTMAEVLRGIERPLTIYLPDAKRSDDLAVIFPMHRFIASADFLTAKDHSIVVPGMDDAAYLLFTSGSTGVPKGVQVSHANIRQFIDVMVDRYSITCDDRLSQMFELVFDLSLFDMFIAWECGACLCCPSKGDAQLPARYINQSKITIWFSVPSLAVAMANMRMLKPNLYPTLRLSLFCGEALRHDIADQWSRAAANSIIENLYGPTEVTLACTYYRWTREAAELESENGLVPIGYAYPGMTAIIVDGDLNEVANGEDGELLMAGPQVATGYWQDDEKTDAAFLIPPGQSQRFYRTGDLVRQKGTDAPITYRGRIDHQVKIRGNRIELGEIEVTLRKIDNVEEAVAVGWPISASGVEAITVFLQGSDIDIESAKSFAEARLPSYMVPRQIHVVPDMPLNQNGKIDRKALVSSLQSEA